MQLNLAENLRLFMFTEVYLDFIYLLQKNDILTAQNKQPSFTRLYNWNEEFIISLIVAKPASTRKPAQMFERKQ